MKKAVVILLSMVLIFMLVGCSSTDQEVTTNEKGGEVERVSEEELDHLYTDPDKFKNKEVELYAKIFVPVEKDDEGTYIQAFADPKNGEKNTIIMIEDTDIDLKEDDVIHVIGTVKGKMEGENVLGGAIVAPAILASSIEKTDYATAFVPAIKTIEDIPEQEQNGCKLKIEKIELAKEETRLYVKLDNGTDDNISFYDFDTIIVQGDKQYEVEENFEANYEEPQSELSPGVSTEGIIAFPAIDLDKKEIKVISEVYSDNFDLEFEPYTFEITWD